MASIFLSHTSIDKPFVEKLAKDLKRVGVNVWFDKWEIGVGESLLWKINNGITTNEFLGIILTKEALESEWVKAELDAGWIKQMNSKKVIILPILLRECEIPLLLAGRKYADFRTDYDNGFAELAAIFGIKNTETISESNWRKFAKGKNDKWKKYREIEFGDLVTSLVARAREFNWSVWTGSGNNKFAVSVSAHWYRQGIGHISENLSIRLCGRTTAYMISPTGDYNPNHLNASDFSIHLGNSINGCEEYVWRRMKTYNQKYGRPDGDSVISTYKFLNTETRTDIIKDSIRKFDWDNNFSI